MVIEVAVMGPKYQINLGHIARVSKNFGVKKLLLINPRCNYKGKLAIKYSKHARDLLENARVSGGIRRENAFVIGTTGIWHKTGNAFYNIYSINEVAAMAKRAVSSRKKLVILLGRDDTGLSKDELRMCDATVSIGTDGNYPILNISHALAIILHALSGKADVVDGKTYADYNYQKRLFTLFGALVRGNPKIRDKDSVDMAFRHVVRRAVPTKKEVNALSIALAPHKSVKSKPKHKKHAKR